MLTFFKGIINSLNALVVIIIVIIFKESIEIFALEILLGVK